MTNDLPNAAFIRVDGVYWLYDEANRRWRGFHHYDGETLWQQITTTRKGTRKADHVWGTWLNSRTRSVLDLDRVSIFKGGRAAP